MNGLNPTVEIDTLRSSDGEHQIPWDEFNTKYKSKKRRTRAVLVNGVYERNSMQSRLKKAFNEGRFEFAYRGYGAAFYNPMADCVDNILVESVGSNHWKSYFKGLDCVEVLANPSAIFHINKHGFEKEFNAIDYKYPGDTPDGRLLSLLLGDKYTQVEHKTFRGHRGLTEKFSFPFSLFRPGMIAYMENPWDPTPEEFLFCLVMEGVNATTAEEKHAVRKAQLLVQGEV